MDGHHITLIFALVHGPPAAPHGRFTILGLCKFLCKYVCVVICQKRRANVLHIVQLKPLPSHHLLTDTRLKASFPAQPEYF